MKYIIQTNDNYMEGAGGTTAYWHFSYEIVEDIDLYLPDLKISDETHEPYVNEIYNCSENLDFTTLFNYELTFDDFITLNKNLHNEEYRLKLKNCCPKKLDFDETLFKYGLKFNDVINLNKNIFTDEELSMKLKDCCSEITKNKISIIISDDFSVSSYLIDNIEEKLNLKSVSKDLLKNLDKKNYSKRFEDYVYRYKLEDLKEHLKMCDDNAIRIQDILKAVYNPVTVSWFPQYDIYRKFNIDERIKRFNNLINSK